MTDNKFIDAFKRMLTMTLALIMVLGSVIPIATQEASAFGGKVGSKYTVTDGGQIRYGSGDGGYSNSRKCDLDDDLGSRYSYCVQPAKNSPPITLTEEQGEKLVKALGQRMLDKQKARTERDPYER